MSNQQSSLRIALFCSYSHKDIQYKNQFETVISTLQLHGLIKTWSDAQVVPGKSISAAIQAKLPESDIFVSLFSPDYLASKECLKEWDRAKELESNGQLVYRVPIILRDCAWLNFLATDDVKVLPSDGTPITSYPNRDSAWQEVYEGIKTVVDSLRRTFQPRPTFHDFLSQADLPASKPVTLDDIFVFPQLVEHNYRSSNDSISEPTVSTVEELRQIGNSVIHGEDESGKTALAKHLVQHLINRTEPVLFADMGTATSRLDDRFLRRLYEEQYHGDYFLWKQQSTKTLIIDNLTDAPDQIDFVVKSSEIFANIFVFTSSDIFHAFLSDENRLTDFRQIRIDPLTLAKQEQLIRRRLITLGRDNPLPDGFVDEVEDRVNSIIIENKIVPRYPFFVLAILQTYDALMPPSLSITSYGHCYHVFIVASLSRAGIAESDESLNSCFNFLEQLAFETFLVKRGPDDRSVDFVAFKNRYNASYFIETSVVSRLTHNEFGIITPEGQFKTAYMYYYFLGKLIASNSNLAEKYLPDLCEESHYDSNYLTLLFAIHHATDDEIISRILIGMMIELEDLSIATLDKDETSRFSSIVSKLPKSVLSDSPVEEERVRERETKDKLEEPRGDESDEELEEVDGDPAKILRVFKNNRILGQVLRNQSGKLQKAEIEDIVEIVADSSFRLINILLKDEDEIQSLAQHIHARYPDADVQEVQEILTWWSFLWTMVNIEQAVHAVNVPSIRSIIDAVADRHDTPAYEIFRYFWRLDSGTSLSRDTRKHLEYLHKKHKDNFVRQVLSIRTQNYMNTHHSNPRIEQSICSFLNVEYRPRPKSIKPHRT